MNEPTNQVADAAPKTFRELLLTDSYQKQISQALPRGLTAERMCRVVLTAMNKTPKLLECTKESLWECVLNCASLGLFPDALGRAYLIPFNDRKNDRVICTLIIGYKGLIDLSYRSERIASIQLVVVRKGDKFIRQPLSNPPIQHEIVEAEGDAFRMLTHVYSVVYLKDCAIPSIDVMSKREVDEIKARSKSGDIGPWKTDYEEMAKKTVFRRHSKVLPMTAELAQAMDVDHDQIDFDAAKLVEGTVQPARFTKDGAEKSPGKQALDDATEKADEQAPRAGAATIGDCMAAAKRVDPDTVQEILEAAGAGSFSALDPAKIPDVLRDLIKASKP